MRSRFFEKNTLEERIEIFINYFERDLETFFTSSVACCERCFERFKEEWPGTVAKDEKLQRGSMDITHFLATSRIRDNFYQEEIDEFSKHLKCPSCDNVLDGYFYIYEHPFSVPDDFDLLGLARLARSTPFLLLTDTFAARTLEAVVSAGSKSDPERLPRTCYRARKAGGTFEPDLAFFFPPPAKLVAEGRYNHAGKPVWYLADSRVTAVAEMGLVEEPLHVASLEIDMEIKVLDLTVSNDIDDEWGELRQCLARSALCAAPKAGQGWDSPEYIFTRFVADCAIHGGFGAVRYGSTKGDGANIVILNLPPDLRLSAKLVAVHTV